MNPDFAPQNDKVPVFKKQTASHLQVLISAMEDIVFEIDGNHVFRNVWANDETILFMPSSEFIHKKVGDVMGRYARRFTKAIDEVIISGEEKQIEYKHLNGKINEWFIVKIRPVSKSEDLNKYILVLIVQNITKQKLSALKLRETQKRLEVSIDLMRVSQNLSETSGWELDVQSGKFLWTRQNHILFDVSPEFVPTIENVLMFFVEEDRALIKKSIKEVIERQKQYDLELRIITAKGQEKWVHAIAKPVIKKDRTSMLMGAFKDITLKKKYEQTLIDLKNVAEAAAESKSKFLSVMSHEIRTPLHGIIGIANILKRHHTLQQESYIKNLVFSANYLLLLVNDILDLSKFESSGLELWPKNVDLFQLVRNIKSQFKSLADAKGIQLRTLLDNKLPIKVSADPIRLGQILNNLISNAIKFTDRGEVILSVKLLSKEEHAALIRFSVKDTGIGIPQEFHETLLESFRQYQQVTYPNPTGTGLGLSITNKLVEAHNSKLFFESEEGVGSEFYFDLSLAPLNNEENTDPFRTSMELLDHELKLIGLTILVVEDNAINTLIARKQLESFGLSPDCVESSNKALEILSEKSYHVVLMDLHLPHMDGYALSKIIQERWPETHIIIFTADISEEVKVKFAEAGIYDILNKPFSPEKLFEKLLKVAQEKDILKKKD